MFCPRPEDIHSIPLLFKKIKTKENPYFSAFIGGILNCFYLRLATANTRVFILHTGSKMVAPHPQSNPPLAHFTPQLHLNPKFSNFPLFLTPPQIEKSPTKTHFVSVSTKISLQNHQNTTNISFFLIIFLPEANFDNPLFL